MTLEILDGKIVGRPQNESDATYYIRRKPHQSEITLEELENETATFLYNKVRMLQDPYPNAFIRTRDNKKLLIKAVEIEN